MEKQSDSSLCKHSLIFLLLFLVNLDLFVLILILIVFEGSDTILIVSGVRYLALTADRWSFITILDLDHLCIYGWLVVGWKEQCFVKCWYLNYFDFYNQKGILVYLLWLFIPLVDVSFLGVVILFLLNFSFKLIAYNQLNVNSFLIFSFFLIFLFFNCYLKLMLYIDGSNLLCQTSNSLLLLLLF